MENGNSDDARVLAGPAACKRYSDPKPSPENEKKEEINILAKYSGELAEATKWTPF